MANDIKINFIGTVVDSVDLPKFETASVAGNKMQLGIIKELYFINNNTEVTSSYPNKMYKFKGRVLISGGKRTIENGIKSNYVSYINLIFLKQITLFIGYFVSLFLWCAKNRGNKALVVYNTLSYIAFPVIIIGKLCKCKTFCVVADLPIKDIRKSFIQSIEDRMEIWLINKFDGLIPLTKYIQKDFAPDTPFIVVEAGFDNIEGEISIPKNKCLTTNAKNVVFTGTLNSLSGVELLLDAFSIIENENIKLHIYGSGNKENVVRKYIENDDRIYFHGKVTNEEILEIQKKADLLVSPRVSDDFTTRYTFPSKVLEYITSGKPVLSNRLPGIPTEYNDLINLTQTSRRDEWANMITKIVCDETNYYLQKAQDARRFVEKNKTWRFQTGKIYNFISGFYN